MEGGGGGGGGATSCLMSFGENNHSGVGSNNNNQMCAATPPLHMMMMMSNNNTLFFANPIQENNNKNSSIGGHGAGGGYNGGGGGNNMMEEEFNNNEGIISSSVKAKIMSHPYYPRLLSAYLNCQKIGAPPEVVARLEEACSASAATMGRSGGMIGQDPGLDQFMEAYCEMLTKYEQELSKPFKEAMLFLSRIESQFKALSIASSDSGCGDAMDRNGSSEEEVDVNNSLIDPQAEDRELKGQLLRKYSGYLGSLKQEFMKKRKKGKLPKEARQQLLDWWSRHYKWPYPSESQKLALAETTGLDQKQINNWFINQRKRHWKPSEDMQFVVMDASAHPHYYMDGVLGNPFPMDISPAGLL